MNVATRILHGAASKATIAGKGLVRCVKKYGHHPERNHAIAFDVPKRAGSRPTDGHPLIEHISVF